MPPAGADLSRVLAFKPHLRLECCEAVAFIVAERERFVLSGASAAEIAELLDGRRAVRELLEHFAGKLSPSEVLATLAEFEARGLLVEAPSTPATASARFLSALGADSIRPRVSAADTAFSAELVAALNGAELELTRDAGVRVLVTHDYLAADVERELIACRLSGTACFLIQPVGITALIGPLLAPDHGPCWGCLHHALERQRPVERLLSRLRADGSRVAVPPAALDAGVRGVLSLATVRLRMLLDPRTDMPREARRELVSVDFPSLKSTAHQVRRRPQCPVCGDPSYMTRLANTPIELGAQTNAFIADGGFRTRSPADTYERLEPLVSQVLGPVTHLTPMPGRNAARRPVFSSGYLVCPRGTVPRRNVFDRICAGKGRSVEQARASALAEAIERYAGVYQGDEAALRASFEQLAPEAIAPNELQLFSDAQLRTGGGERDAAGGSRVPRLFDPSAAIDWTPAWSLTHGRRRYVPLACCYSEAPAESGIEYCAPSSNGSAAGNCLEESILQGTLELVERDAAAVWWYNRIRRPAVDLRASADPWVEALVAEYRELGWSVWALDLTHDLEIPVIAAVACHTLTRRFTLGFGCHLGHALALERALTELNQVFDPSGATPSPWDGLSAARETHVRPSSEAQPRPTAETVHAAGADLRASIELCIQRLARAGLELMVVNKSRPDIELHVAQVIVPGLRHVWPRFAPGRLYDVPVALGWTERALSEAELNPKPLLI